MSIGMPPGCLATASFAAGGRLRHELYIDRGTPEECKAPFDALQDQRQAVEAAYGKELKWERLDTNKASRIADYRPGKVDNADEHDGYIDWFINAGDRLRSTIAAIPIG